jgi:GNAT superfamily N-acetyltransferase
VKPIAFPSGFRIETLRRDHPRGEFDCGESQVDDWLRTKALQQQTKRLSSTKVLVADSELIAGYYTLATGQIDFGDLPTELVRKLPRRSLPVAILAWLGVDQRYRGRGLGDLLLAQALRDCQSAGETFAFVAVVLDCVDAKAKAFYERWEFQQLPGHPFRLFISANLLAELIAE